MKLHLASLGIYVDCRCVLTSKDKRSGKPYRGGFDPKRGYEKARADLCDWMKEDKDPACRFTTMFDLYGLPQNFPSDGEIYADAYEGVAHLEDAFARDVGDVRFIPYIQLHEFEALIFADLSKLEEEYFERRQQIWKLLQETRNLNPELIDNGPSTAPSKRIIAAVPEYEGEKPRAGVSVMERIGLAVLRSRCRHFNSWVEKLESL